MRIFLNLVLNFILSLGSGLSLAASVTISPMSIELTDKNNMAILNLTNDAQTSSSFQVRAFSWKQDQNGNSILNPAPKIAISPPILTIEPKSQSIVRIIRMSRDPIIGEENYRLQIEELPSPEEQSSSAGINFLMSYSLPIFATSKHAQTIDPIWHMSVDKTNLHVKVINNGQTKIKIDSFKIMDSESNELLDIPSAGYVLGGMQVTFRYPHNGKLSPNSKIKLLAKVGLYAHEYTDFGELNLEPFEQENSSGSADSANSATN